MKECVAGKQRTRPMEIQWQNERDGTIKRAALGMFIIQEEKQKITISHNMLNSLNDTIAHTAHWRCTRACAHTPSPAAAQLLGRDVSLSMFGIECKEPFALDPQIEIHFE